MNLYDFENAIIELMDKALNELSPAEFDKLKDDIRTILSDYEA